MNIETNLNLTTGTPIFTGIRYLAALPGGQAVIFKSHHGLVQINKQGQTVGELCTCPDTRGILVLGDKLCVLLKGLKGNIRLMSIQHNEIFQEYDIPNVGFPTNTGCLYWDTDSIDPDLLLLTDGSKKKCSTTKCQQNRNRFMLKV